jgi:hypothetical protein
MRVLLLISLPPEVSVADATWVLVVVTALFVIATFFLVLDGAKSRKFEKQRWDKDSKRRKREARPRARIEVVTESATSRDMAFVCFNLGSNTFYVDRIIVTAQDGTWEECPPHA